MLSDDARLDLYACSVADGIKGKYLVDELAAVTGADVYASDNVVGSGDEGDYVWEYYSGISLRPELFSIPQLELVEGFALRRQPIYKARPPDQLPSR